MVGLDYKPDESFVRTWKWSGRIMGGIAAVALVMMWHARLTGSTKKEAWLWPAQRERLQERARWAAEAAAAEAASQSPEAGAAGTVASTSASGTSNSGKEMEMEMR